MSAHEKAVVAAAMEFSANLPHNPAEITNAVWMAALHQALERYEAARGEPLVEAYMRHVVNNEGITFVSYIDEDDGFTPEQIAALKTAEQRVTHGN